MIWDVTQPGPPAPASQQPHFISYLINGEIFLYPTFKYFGIILPRMLLHLVFILEDNALRKTDRRPVFASKDSVSYQAAKWAGKISQVTGLIPLYHYRSLDSFYRTNKNSLPKLVSFNLPWDIFYWKFIRLRCLISYSSVAWPDIIYFLQESNV